MTDLTAQLAALSARVQRLEDEAAIVATIARYGQCLDYGEEARWVDCFVEDGVYDLRLRQPRPAMAAMFPCAVVDDHRVTFRGHDQLRQFAARHTRAPDVLHKHFVADHQFDWSDGPDSASVTSYFMRLDEIDGVQKLTSFGRYHDRMRRSADGRWRFAERVGEIESSLRGGRPKSA